MAEPEQYEALVLGSGAGGKLLAWHLAGSGRRTAVVERKWIGGSCPNILGFTMIGPEAGEVMAAVQTAMLGGLPCTVFRDAILAHPTMAEGLNGLFAAIPGSGGARI
jgi:pyruvate/2-oxoglutarate dehydrogenase complex dihydrolipoamide dehydrogenase (E3) component